MIKIGMLIGDRYEILEKIGTGGMSDVYKAKCHKLNRYVAVKVLKQEFSENTNFVSKFHVEAQAAAGLMHPNIVNVYDVGEEDGINYIVMELVEGITLKNYIEKKARLSVKEAISIAIQVSMGIEAAHNNHIIHRDIKPQNIMISKEGKVKIADFGIAKAATSNTITSNVMGSVHYTSPEQARGGFSDERSDIYSLGCTMFEMLTGRVPFDGETTVAIAIKHIQEEMASPREYVSEIPVCVEQIIFKCTQKSPDRRYQSMGELIVDLKKSLMYPEENFVQIISADTGGATKMISEEDIAEIKQRTGHIDLEEPMRLKDREIQRMTSAELEADDDELDVIAPQPVKRTVVPAPIPTPAPAPAPAPAPVAEEYSSKEYEDDDYDEEYDDDDMDPKMERITTILAIIVAVVIGILVLLLVANAVGIFKGPSSGEKAEITRAEEGGILMIDVVGKTKEEAKALLNELNLGTKITEQSSNEPAGIVISQGIMAGEEVEEYTTIDLVVSSGNGDMVTEETEGEETQDEEEGVEIVAVVGMDSQEAADKLTALGFLVKTEEEASDDVEAGKVMTQSPEAGNKVPAGTEITLKVSSGPEVKTVKVPNLAETSVDDAKAKITAAGLKVGTITYEESEKTPGTVLSQDPAADKEVDAETVVNLVVSKEPEVVTYKYSAAVGLEMLPGYAGGEVIVTVTSSAGEKKTYTLASVPGMVDLAGFTTDSGTVTYTYATATAEIPVGETTGTEMQTQATTTSEVPVTFTRE